MNTVDIVKILVTEDEYSAYGISTVLNNILKWAGASEIRPQMMYNYARNGMIVPKVQIAGATLRKITKDEVVAFVVRFVEKRKIDLTGMIKPVDVQLEIDIDELIK